MPQSQPTPMMSTMDPRMSVGVNTPMLSVSSPADGLEVIHSDSVHTASSGLSSAPVSGVKRERSVDSGEVTE